MEGCARRGEAAMTDGVTPSDHHAERGLDSTGNAGIDHVASGCDLHAATDVECVPQQYFGDSGLGGNLGYEMPLKAGVAFDLLPEGFALLD